MKFQIYSYMFRPINLLDFDGDNNINPQESFAKKQDILEEILQDDNIKFKDEEKDYGHKHLISKDGISIFKIQNYKTKTIENNDFIKSKIDHFPSSLVIIDNRKDVQRIAIECVAFGKNELSEILQYTFRTRLKDFRLSIDIRAEYKKDDFWTFCNKYKQLGGIEYIIFSFPYPNLPRISDMVGEYFTQVAKNTNSEPILKLQGQGDEGVTIDEQSVWMNNAVEACSASGTKLEVKPKNGSMRVIGQESCIIEEMDPIDDNNLATSDLFDENIWFIRVAEMMNNIKLTRD